MAEVMGWPLDIECETCMTCIYFLFCVYLYFGVVACIRCVLEKAMIRTYLATPEELLGVFCALDLKCT